MNNNQKFIGGLLLGAAAGAIITLFLKSDKGKELISEVKDAANSFGNNVKNKVDNIDDDIDTLIAKGKAYLEELQQKKASQNNA